MPGLLAAPIKIEAKRGKAIALPYLSNKIVNIINKHNISSFASLEIQELSNKEQQKIVVKFDDMWEWHVYTPGRHLRGVYEDDVSNDQEPDELFNI